ncbi:MAG: zinc ribbon domain-containing protein [Candidatus Muiribacteriota bacterium]
MSNNNIIICQSCGLPIYHDTLFGTDKDGKITKKYCILCYLEGEFTYKDISMDTLIEVTSVILSISESLPIEIAKKICQNTIPTLERWR